MRSINEQADIILSDILLQDAQMRAAGVPAQGRAEAMLPGLQARLVQFQDELLETQRATNIALAQALEMKGK